MRPGERKACRAVIKRCRRPSRRFVAQSTILGKSARDMIGISCALVARQMARHACGRQRGVLPAAVTGIALQARMRAGKWERNAAMIERRILPGGH